MAKIKGLSRAKAKAKSIGRNKNNSKSGESAFDKNSEIQRRGLTKQIRTWDDIDHESEDEYYEERDKILLEDESEGDQYQSDTEVFGLGGGDGESSSDQELDGSEYEYYSDQSGSKDLDAGDQDLDENENENDGAWGARKQSYYNRDEILASSDEEQAENDEEAEALQLQRRMIASLSASDFVDDDALLHSSSSTAKKSKNSKLDKKGSQISDPTKISSFSDLFDSATTPDLGETVQLKVDRDEQLIQINKLSTTEKRKLVAARHPELAGLLHQLRASNQSAKNYRTLINKSHKVFGNVVSKHNKEFVFVEALYQLHLVLISNISFYLMLLSSSRANGNNNVSEHGVFSTINKTLDTIDILNSNKDSIIEALVSKIESKAAKNKKKNKSRINNDSDYSDFDSDSSAEQGSDIESGSELDHDLDLHSQPEVSDDDAQLASVSSSDRKKLKKAKLAKKLAKLDDFSNEDFIKLQKKYKTGSTKKFASASLSTKPKGRVSSDMQDFGEQTELVGADAMDKSASIQSKKLSLRYMASKAISTKSKKQKHKMQLALAGDVDLPYAERSKFKIVDDKNASTNNDNDKDADRSHDLDFGGNSNDEEEGNASDQDGEDYYKTVKKQAEKRKRSKQTEKAERKSDAWKQVLEENLELEAMEVIDPYTSGGPKQARPINYQILKNKGLTPKRRKIDRNPRVKRKVKYEAAKKKLASIRKVYKQPTTAYGGETTGIKTHLSKSTKFN